MQQTNYQNHRIEESSFNHRRFANGPAASAREDGATAESIATSISNAVARSGGVATNHDPTYDTNNQQQDYGTAAAKQPLLRIEETEDGVRLIIPVETTKPASMKPWTKLEQEKREEKKISNKKGHKTNELDYSEEDDWMLPLATSVRRDSRIARRLLGDNDNDNSTNTKSNTRIIEKPLEIELRRRRCESSGPEAGARAFLMGPEPLSIVLCHNRINAESDEVAEILTHELIHLYDVQTLQLDLSDCETVAYSEVRAAREAECGELGKDLAKVAESTKKSTFSKLQESFNNKVYKPYCVRNIALGATQNMFPREGKKCINKVWETAYGDHRPFGRNLQQKKERDTAAAAASSRLYNTSSGTSHGTSDK